METNNQFPIVVALIKDKEGRMLLQKRVDPLIPDAHEKWEIPGGKIHFGETAEEAIRRECQEEVGCSIVVKRLLPLAWSKTWVRTDGEKFHVLAFGFEAEILEGDPQPSDKKVSQVGWFTREEISALDTLAGVEEFIRSAET